MNPEKLLGVAVALLGALNFIFGFLPQYSSGGNSSTGGSLSVYVVGPGYVPILLLIAGLLALAAFVPGSERSRLAVAAVSVGGAVAAVISIGTTSPGTSSLGTGLGAILLTVFGIVQAVIAIGGYVIGTGVSPRITGTGGQSQFVTASAGATGVTPGAAGPPVGWVGPSGAPSGWPGQQAPVEQPGSAPTGGWSGPAGQSGSAPVGGWSGPAGQSGSAPTDGWPPGGRQQDGEQPFGGQPLGRQAYGGQAFPGQPQGRSAEPAPHLWRPSAAAQPDPAEPPTGPQSVIGLEAQRSDTEAAAGTDPAGRPATAVLGDRSTAEQRPDEIASDVVDLATPAEQFSASRQPTAPEQPTESERPPVSG